MKTLATETAMPLSGPIRPRVRDGVFVLALLAAVLFAAAWFAAGCSRAATNDVPSVPVTDLPGHGQLAQDDTPKESPRMMPPESYIRSYLMLFGGLAPLPLQKAAQAKDGTALFDTWNDYLSSLGLPDYRVDVPRGQQTNTLMVATFERLGIALCDRSVEHDWNPATPAAQRTVFAFDMPKDSPGAPVAENVFAAGFDVLHRTFLGYPSSLAPKERLGRYYTLYTATVAAHAKEKGSRFSPSQAGWAQVCYGLLRHPEFQLY